MPCAFDDVEWLEEPTTAPAEYDGEAHKLYIDQFLEKRHHTHYGNVGRAVTNSDQRSSRVKQEV